MTEFPDNAYFLQRESIYVDWMDCHRVNDVWMLPGVGKYVFITLVPGDEDLMTTKLLPFCGDLAWAKAQFGKGPKRSFPEPVQKK